MNPVLNLILVCVTKYQSLYINTKKKIDKKSVFNKISY